ncbi:MAG: M48 family metalloprotease [Candidatus Sericytochromatia bacterium]
MKTLIAFLLALSSLFGYCSKKTTNPITGKKQYVSLTPQQEITLGLRSVPEVSKKYGGIEFNTISDQRIDKIGAKIINNSKVKETIYKFEFNVLKDTRTVNAFALPGGQVFITQALLSRLKTDGQIAGVLGHEIAHVVARHSAQQMAKQSLTSGIVGAVAVGTYDINKPNSQYAGDIARLIGSTVNMKYGRADELESDSLGLKFMSDAGYNPNSMIEVMNILKQTSGSGLNLEFFSTHPNPDNRISKIQKEIKKIFPNGVPNNLEN